MWIQRVAEEIQIFLQQHIIRNYLRPEFLGVASPLARQTPNDSSEISESILWAVPKKRRSLEKRMTRRFGSKHWGTSKLVPMNHRIRVDNKTGEFFVLGQLAPRTFRAVMDETQSIQKKVKDLFGKEPKNAEVGVRYVGENKRFGTGTKIVEMETERPKFFSRSLVEKTAYKKGSTTFRPTGLG
uniref:39S ribosomal protein L32, mitochondrial n=1 Tax=Caligus rogercresseyi TaxID=217165 RepID=C1BR43_CALRO|nr:39S ribosomal protein L32, mitochondrial precursor [Caligus rogercresseyi]